jgi:hypothetical protein
VQGGAQFLQRVCPVEFVYVPAGHETQPVLAAVLVEKVPAGHASHLEEPLAFVLVPAEHAVHEEAPDSE